MKNMTLHFHKLFVGGNARFFLLGVLAAFVLAATVVSCSSSDDEEGDSVIYSSAEAFSPTVSTDKVLLEYLNAEQQTLVGADINATRWLEFKKDDTFVCTTHYNFTYERPNAWIEAVYSGTYSGGFERITQKGGVRIFGKNMDFLFNAGNSVIHTQASLNEDGVDLVIEKNASTMTISDPLSLTSDAILSREVADDEEED